MEINPLALTDFLDILFEGRNKEYGAYELRRTYNRRLLSALLLTGLCCMVLSGAYLLSGHWSKSVNHNMANVSDLVLSDINLKDKVQPFIRIPRPQTPKAETVKLVTMRILKDIMVSPADEVPSNKDLDMAKIDISNQKGNPEDNSSVLPTSIGNGTIAGPAHSQIEDEPFTKVEIESSYAQGEEAWRRFLIKNFHPSEEAINNGIQGTVIVEFIVDVEGNVSGVKAVSGPKEYWQEAVRVIGKSGKWTAAIQNGRQVKSFKRQPIIIQLQGE
jgi:protein TonB